MKKFFLLFFVVICIILVYIQLYSFDVHVQQKTNLVAEIRGEINSPGTYEIACDETLQSLIDKAGGLSEEADISSLSLVKLIEHQDVIVIPKKSYQDKISINSATLEELMTLSGIGASKAQSILEYRKQHSFQALEDIMNVKGIGEKIFEKIKEQIKL